MTDARGDGIAANPAQQTNHRLRKLRDFGIVSFNHFEVMLVGDGIEEMRIIISSLAGVVPPAQQILLGALAEGRALQVIAPDVQHPRRFRGTTLLIEVVPNVNVTFVEPIHVCVIVIGEAQRLQGRIPGLERVSARQLEIGEELIELSVRSLLRRIEVVRSLRPNQVVPIHVELVLPRLATEDGVIIENEAMMPTLRMLGILMRRHQAGQTAAYDNQVENLARIVRSLRNLVVESISHPMRGLHYRQRVAVCIRIIAYATVAAEGVTILRRRARTGLGLLSLCNGMHGTRCRKQRRSTTKKRAVEKVTTCDRRGKS